MSELHTTLFVVSCLAALGLGVSAGLVYCYYGHWRPTIHAYQAALRDIHRLTRRELLPEDDGLDTLDTIDGIPKEDWLFHSQEEMMSGWEIIAPGRLRMIARRTV